MLPVYTSADHLVIDRENNKLTTSNGSFDLASPAGMAELTNYLNNRYKDIENIYQSGSSLSSITAGEKMYLLKQAIDLATKLKTSNPAYTNDNDFTTALSLATNALSTYQASNSWLSDMISELEEARNEAMANGDQDQVEILTTKLDQLKGQQVSNQVAQSGEEAPELCSLYNPSTWPKCLFAYTLGIIQFIFGGICFIAGLLFDFSFYLTIIKIKSFFDNEGVKLAWQVARDLTNTFFFFIVFYLSLGKILNIGAPKFNDGIKNVIIVALLVNFSGFFVRTTIDASNIMANHFYKQISPNHATGQAFNPISGSISSQFLKNLSLVPKLIEGEDGGPDAIVSLSVPQMFIAFLLNLVFLLVTSFVFFAGAILLAIRTVSLMIVFIMSPLAFLCLMFPGQRGKFDKWMHTMLDQSFFAPFYIFLIWVVLAILEQGDGLTGVFSQQGQSYTGSWSDLLSLTVFQLIIISLMVSTILLAKQMGAKGLNLAKSSALSFNTGSRYLLGRTGKLAAQKAKWAGKALDDKFNDGRISKNLQEINQGVKDSRIGKSWQTGILKDIRETKLANQAGDVIKNPVFTGTELVNTTYGVDVVHRPNYKQADETKRSWVSSFVAGDKNDTFDKKAKRFAMLNSGERSDFYQQLSPEDRVKYETELRKQYKQSGNDKLKPVVSEVVQLRTNLQGQAAKDTAKKASVIIIDDRNQIITELKEKITKESGEQQQAEYRRKITEEENEIKKILGGINNKDLTAIDKDILTQDYVLRALDNDQILFLLRGTNEFRLPPEQKQKILGVATIRARTNPKLKNSLDKILDPNDDGDNSEPNNTNPPASNNNQSNRDLLS